jgi:hypothetical protein
MGRGRRLFIPRRQLRSAGLPLQSVWGGGGAAGVSLHSIFSEPASLCCRLMSFPLLVSRITVVHQVPTAGDIATSGPSFPSEDVEEAEDGEDGDEPERASLMLMRGLFLFVFFTFRFS